MIKHISTGLLVFSCLGLIAGCDDKVDNVPYCSGSEGSLCDPPGFPFVTELGSFGSDACSSPGQPACPSADSLTTKPVTHPQDGQVCTKGSVGRNGFAWLLATVSRWNKANTHIVDVFDAKALGITGFQFTITTPPATGISMFATTVKQRDCFDAPSSCLNGWDLMTGARSNLVKVLDQSGTVTAPFTDFGNVDPNLLLDSSALAHFIFVISPGAYDFCLSDFKFLDVQGNEVMPAIMADAAVTGG